MRHLVPLGIACLAACTPVPEPDYALQCPGVDWRAYGLADGRLGQPVSRAQDFFEGCLAVGAPPDLAAYAEGRAEGLVSYCTAENGYEVGVEGRRYHDVCPPDLATAFLQGLSRGRDDRPPTPVYAYPYPYVGAWPYGIWRWGRPHHYHRHGHSGGSSGGGGTGEPPPPPPDTPPPPPPPPPPALAPAPYESDQTK